MSWIVDSRCAIAIVVRPAIRTPSASRISSSVSVSMLEVASSRTRTRGSNARARANDSSCFCPTDKRCAPLRHRTVVTGRQPLDESVRVNRFGRPLDVRVGNGPVAQPDVGGDGPGEQVHVLQDQPKQPAQRREIHVADVDAVDEDRGLA